MRDLPLTVPAWSTLTLDALVSTRNVGDLTFDCCLYSDADGLVTHPLTVVARAQ